MLLAKARILGGDRLAIDIAEAEAALRLFSKVEKSATVIQVRHAFVAYYRSVPQQNLAC